MVRKTGLGICLVATVAYNDRERKPLNPLSDNSCEAAPSIDNYGHDSISLERGLEIMSAPRKSLQRGHHQCWINVMMPVTKAV